MNNLEGVQYSLRAIAEIKQAQGKNDEALQLFVESLEISEKIGLKSGIACISFPLP